MPFQSLTRKRIVFFSPQGIGEYRHFLPVNVHTWPADVLLLIADEATRLWLNWPLGTVSATFLSIDPVPPTIFRSLSPAVPRSRPKSIEFFTPAVLHRPIHIILRFLNPHRTLLIAAKTSLKNWNEKCYA